MTAPYGLLAPPMQPDAITSLLQQLTMPPVQQTPSAGPGMPPPQAAPLPPPMDANTASSLLQALPDESRPSLISRVGHNLLSIPRAIAEHAQTPEPPEIKAAVQAGLLTQEQADSARPGFLSSVAGTAAQNPAGPQGAFRDAVTGILNVREQQRLKAVRAGMEQLFQPQPGESIDQSRDRLERMYSYAIQHNDAPTAKMLEPVATEAIKRPKSFAALHEIPGVGLVDASDPQHPRVVVPVPAGSQTPHVVNAQEGVFLLKPDGLYNAATGEKWTKGMVHPIAMMPSFTTVQDYNPNDPNAPPQTRTLNTRTGQPGAVIATGKPATTRIESAMNLAAEARLKAAVSEMNNADPAMAAYEQKLATHQTDISGVSQLMGSIANTFTHDDPISKATQSASLALLNRQNPELARYIRRGLSFAEAESMISQRPSDFRTRMAAFLSSAATGASPEMIGDIQSRRSAILTPLNATIGAQPSSATPSSAARPSGSSASPLSAKYDAAYGHLKAQGKTDAQIKSVIGERP